MNSVDLNTLEAWQAARLLARRELLAADLARACLDRIVQRDGEIHAFAHLDPDHAMAQAHALDRGAIRGPLHGLPLGVKDLFDTVDFPTTYGSPIYEGHRPDSDAAAVALCREAGALVIGKTVTTEFAFFHPGPTCNPRDVRHTPGGSSSGSAAAVADHMLPLALGTQTSGSVIRPAAYCGVVGYKASSGRVPRAGVKSISEALDTLGGFGRSVRDVALLGAVLTGDRRLEEGLDDPKAPRIGMCRTAEWPHADADTQQAWAEASAVLIRHAPATQDVALPEDMPDLVALQKEIMAFQMYRALSYERLCSLDQFSLQLQAQMDDGAKISSASHAHHLWQARTARRRINLVFEQFDVLVAPSAAGEAPIGTDATGDPVFCRGWTLLGLPCVHLPFARGRHGLPIGVQLIGRWGDDHRLLAFAQWVHDRLISKGR
ncbi:amidase [Paraburkholderia sediminicola]|uniref:amidase n=1 Tax=Paraburkholderia sediminicola TaxID=458836 RepID=UPI0038BA8A47